MLAAFKENQDKEWRDKVTATLQTCKGLTQYCKSFTFKKVPKMGIKYFVFTKRL